MTFIVAVIGLALTGLIVNGAVRSFRGDPGWQSETYEMTYEGMGNG